tara:strand:+ start:3725 stop:4732 length:1008 start_codon:yes stop_codon:yes gene_type:complete
MKLKDFTLKSNRKFNSPTTTKYILGNTKYENSLLQEIEKLNSEIQKYSNLQKQRDDAISSLSSEKAKATETRILYEKTKEENLFLLKDVSFYKEKMKEKVRAEEELKEIASKFSSLNNDHTRIISQNAKVSNDLELITKQKDALVKENEQYRINSLQAEADKFSAEEERNMAQSENLQLKNTANELSIINKRVKEDNKTLRDEVNLHRKEAQERLIALDESKMVESKLRVWVNDLESNTAKTKGKNTTLNKKLETFEKTVKDMATTIEQIMEENSYIRALNKQYREELNKPRYMSMATISRKEKLNMPTETVFRRSVGNASQPLIKFKQEKTDDN